MFAVIRIASFYSWIRHLSPVVRRSTYSAMAEVACVEYDRAKRLKGELMEAVAAYSRERCATREQHAGDIRLIEELNAEVIELRRQLLEQEQQCSRLAQLLREINQITEAKNVQQKRIDYHVVKELLS